MGVRGGWCERATNRGGSDADMNIEKPTKIPEDCKRV
jgi:hypothetical protein